MDVWRLLLSEAAIKTLSALLESLGLKLPQEFNQEKSYLYSAFQLVMELVRMVLSLLSALHQLCDKMIR